MGRVVKWRGSGEEKTVRGAESGRGARGGGVDVCSVAVVYFLFYYIQNN